MQNVSSLYKNRALTKICNFGAEFIYFVGSFTIKYFYTSLSSTRTMVFFHGSL